MGFLWLLGCSQVGYRLRDHFASTVAHLSPSCALSVAIVCQMFMPLYIIVMPYLRHFSSFVPKNRNAINRSSPLGEIRRFENLENKMVYTTRGKCSVYYASRVSVFF